MSVPNHHARLWRPGLGTTGLVVAAHAALLALQSANTTPPRAGAAASAMVTAVRAPLPQVATTPSAANPVAPPAQQRPAAQAPPIAPAQAPAPAPIAVVTAPPPETSPAQGSLPSNTTSSVETPNSDQKEPLAQTPRPSIATNFESIEASTPQASVPPSAAAAPAATPAANANIGAATAIAHALQVPGSKQLVYELVGSAKGVGYSAKGKLQWQHDGRRYTARMEVSAFLLGSRSQHSEGSVTAQGLSPERFTDKSRSERAAHFHRDSIDPSTGAPRAGRVSFSNNRPDAPWSPGMQDRLSVLLQLGAIVGGAPQRYPVGSSVAVYTASVDEAEVWVFEVDEMLATEAAQLPPEVTQGGTQPTIKLTRKPRREFDSRVEIWLAPAVQWLPVRMRITQANGDYTDQTVQRLE